MNKYVIDLRPDCKVVQEICESDGKVSIGAKSINYLEELNSDYINEHFGDLQDTAYQKGFEDGKAVNDKGCEGCKYSGTPQGDSPCFNCSNYYQNNWTAKQTDDDVKVGDELEHTVSGYTSKAIFLEKIGNDEDEDWYKCLFWTGCGVAILSYPKSQFKRTGNHFDIDKILEEMRND